MEKKIIDVKEQVEFADVADKLNVAIDDNGDVNTDLDVTPDQLPPIDDVIINLGFWLSMLQRVAPVVLQNKLNGLPKSQPDKESEV